MSIQVEIWKSESSTDPADFTLFATVADAAPFTVLDQPLVSGQLFIYKARRLDTVTGAYSDWSNLLFLVGKFPTGGLLVLNQLTNVNPNFITTAGIGIEPSGVPGQAVKAGRRFGFAGFSQGKSGMSRIARTDWNGLPGVSGHINGPAEYPVKLTVASTPEGALDELLCLLCGAPTTTAVAAPTEPAAPTVTIQGAAGTTHYTYAVVARGPQGDSAATNTTAITTGNAARSGTNYNAISWLPVQGATSYLVIETISGNIVGQTQSLSYNDTGLSFGVYAAPSGPTGNQQLYKTNTGFLTGTIPINYGVDNNGNALVGFFAGCRVYKMQLKWDKKPNSQFNFDMDLRALYEVDGVSLSQVGLDVATVDTLSPFSETFGMFMIGGAIADCEQFSISLDTQLSDKHQFTGYAGPVSAYKQGEKHSMSATLCFSTEAERRRFFGAAATGVYAQKNNINYFPVQMAVANPVNGGGIVNQFTLYTAYATYETSEVSIKAKEGMVTQTVTMTPDVDPGATATDVEFLLVNSRTNNGIITPGTLITGFNGGDVNPYSN